VVPCRRQIYRLSQGDPSAILPVMVLPGSLPPFGFDESNYAVVVVGRYVSSELLRSCRFIKELEASVRATAELLQRVGPCCRLRVTEGHPAALLLSDYNGSR
jgi:hypothetical protein